MPPTVEYEDTLVEVHKVVVGPMDNNVYVVRCRQTGDAVLIDAANEHEQLLELCRDLGVRQVLETHGHWDHIQAVPAVRDAGYSVGVTAADAAMLPSYDMLIEDDVRHRGGQPADADRRHPGPHSGLDLLRRRRNSDSSERGHAVSRRARQHEVRGRRLPDDHQVDRRSPLQEVRRGHDRLARSRRLARRSAPRARTCRSGSTGAGDLEPVDAGW